MLIFSRHGQVFKSSTRKPAFYNIILGSLNISALLISLIPNVLLLLFFS